MHQSHHFPSWNKISTFSGNLLQFLSRLKHFPTLWQVDFKTPSLDFKTPETLDKLWLMVRIKIQKKVGVLIIWNLLLPLDTWGRWVSDFSKQINQNYYKPSRRCNHFGILLPSVPATFGQAVFFILARIHFIKLSIEKWRLHSNPFNSFLTLEKCRMDSYLVD